MNLCMQIELAARDTVNPGREFPMDRRDFVKASVLASGLGMLPRRALCCRPGSRPP